MNLHFLNQMIKAKEYFVAKIINDIQIGGYMEDILIRCTSNDGSIRLFCCTTINIVEEARLDTQYLSSCNCSIR